MRHIQGLPLMLVVIGEDGYAKYVHLGGDQQTYAIMKNLKSIEINMTVPGDWHTVLLGKRVDFFLTLHTDLF